MNTYVINMEDSIHKFNIIQQTSNLNPIRFIAKTPKDIDANTHKISPFARLFTPKIPIAIALSHLSLIEHIFNTDTNSYALILEDDATPIEQGIDLQSKIREVIDNTPNNWDIIRLHYFNVLGSAKQGYRAGKSLFSNAAYIVRRESIPFILNKKIYYHFDMQLNHTSLNIYKSPTPLFKTDENESSTRGKLIFPYKNIKGLRSAESWMGFNALRIPFTDVEFTVELLVITVIVVMFMVMR